MLLGMLLYLMQLKFPTVYTPMKRQNNTLFTPLPLGVSIAVKNCVLVTGIAVHAHLGSLLISACPASPIYGFCVNDTG